MTLQKTIIRRGEYAARGDYHKYLNPMWSYYPTYMAKMTFIHSFLDSLNPTTSILDVGCGEGLLVEEYRQKGYIHTWGLDLNYGDQQVMLGNGLQMPFVDHSFQVILLLDVIEHILFDGQPRLLCECKRILEPGGFLVLAIPNLAHLASRLNFLLHGRLSRTASIQKHPGDRPIAEYLDMLHQLGFQIVQRKGLTLMLPWFSTRLLRNNPPRYMNLQGLIDYLPLPDLCFTNMVVVQSSQ